MGVSLMRATDSELSLDFGLSGFCSGFGVQSLGGGVGLGGFGVEGQEAFRFGARKKPHPSPPPIQPEVSPLPLRQAPHLILGSGESSKADVCSYSDRRYNMVRMNLGLTRSNLL